MTRNPQRWRICLGEYYWKQHTHSRLEQAGMQLLGSIARSAQFGALAMTADGRYVQVNGDHILPLSHSQVSRAVRLAEEELKQNKLRAERERRRTETRTPMVIVKRRRSLSLEHV